VSTLEAALLAPSSIERVLLVAYDERVAVVLRAAIERWQTR
jgi:hypothetical protein